MSEVRAVDIKDRSSFEAWLLSRPELVRPIDALILVHRCTLRAVPLLHSQQLIVGNERAELFLTAFRLGIEARITLTRISSSPIAAQQLRKENLSNVTLISAIHTTTYGYSILECMNSVLRVATSAVGSDNALSMLSATVGAVQTLVLNATISPDSSDSIWSSVSADALLLESDENIEKMFRGPLWNVAPKWWQNEVTAMLALFASHSMRNDHWAVWDHWYSPVSAGSEAFYLPAVLARKIEQRIGLSDGRADFWKREPSVINAEIGGWVGEAREQSTLLYFDSPVQKIGELDRPSASGVFSTVTSGGGVSANGEARNFTTSSQSFPIHVEIKRQERLARVAAVPESLLQPPFRAASRFRQATNGQIVLEADPLSPSLGRQHEQMQELYEDARLAVAELLALGINKLAFCLETAKALQDYLPEIYSDASINRIWFRANRLRDLFVRHTQEAAQPQHDRDISQILEPETAKKLETCIKQLNVLIAHDERGRELDRLSHGPEARQRNEAQIAATTPIINNIFYIADGATVSVVQGDHNTVIQASHNIHGDQAVERIAEQESNLVMAILLACRPIVTAIDSVSPEIIVQAAIAVAGTYGPEIIKFVAEHKDSFDSVLIYIENANTIADFLKLISEIGRLI